MEIWWFIRSHRHDKMYNKKHCSIVCSIAYKYIWEHFFLVILDLIWVLEKYLCYYTHISHHRFAMILKCKWSVRRRWCYSLNCVTVSHSVYKILIEFYDLNGTIKRICPIFFPLWYFMCVNVRVWCLCECVCVCTSIRASICLFDTPHITRVRLPIRPFFLFSREKERKKKSETERMTFLFVFIHSLCHFSVSIGRWTE